MKSHITRRRFVQAMTMTSLGAVLAACTPRPTPTPVPPTKAPATQAPVAATQAPAPTAVPTKAPTAVPTKVPVEITIARSEAPFHPLRNDAPALLETTKATGVRINMLAVSEADWAAKQKVWLATKQVPDYMIADLATIRPYANPSVLMPVLPLVEKHAPNVKKYLEASRLTSLRNVIDGQLYMLERDRYNFPRNAPMPCIRKDLLKKHNLPTPDDFDQLYQVLKELKKAYPDAVGWTGRRGIKRTLMWNAYPMGSGVGGNKKGADVPYFDKDVEGGKWLFGPIHPEIKDVLAYFARLYKEGLLDPDIATANDDLFNQRNTTGKGLFVWENMTFCATWNLGLRKTDPQGTWGPIPVLKGKKGRRQNDYSGPTGGYVVGAGCKHPDRLMELIDWQISPEGLDLTSWGIEGVHYTLKQPRPAAIQDYTMDGIGKVMPPGTRKIVPDVFEKYAKKADPYRDFQADIGLGMQMWCLIWDWDIALAWAQPQESDAWYELTAKDPGLHAELMAPPFNQQESEKLKKIVSDVNAIVNPALDKVVLGQMSLTDYDKAVQQMIKAGAEDMEKIYNEAEARLK